MLSGTCGETGGDGVGALAPAGQCLLVDEAHSSVCLQIHGTVCRGCGAHLVETVPVLAEVDHAVHVGHVGQFLVEDAHVGTSAACRQGLQGQVHVLLVVVANHGDDEYFAVRAVAAGGETGTCKGALGIGAPGTSALQCVLVGVDVVYASATHTA